MSGERIRAFEPEDLQAVAAIEAAGQAEPWSAEGFRDELARPGRFIVLESGGRVVGFAGARRVGEEGYLLDIAVDPSHRRRGYGRSLLAFLEARLAAEGGRVLLLDVREDNAGAIAFYRANGFEEAGRRPRAYPDGTGGRTLRKIL